LESHTQASQQVLNFRKDARKPRFQIEKLEDRIAPSRGRYWYHPTPRFCKLYPQYCDSGR
jgi:hypothetical protein